MAPCLGAEAPCVAGACRIARATEVRAIVVEVAAEERGHEERDDCDRPIEAGQRWFAERGVDYLRTYPSAVFDDTPEDLFAPAVDDWGPERWLTQVAWMRTLGREGGLFFTIGRKTAAPRATSR